MHVSFSWMLWRNCQIAANNYVTKLLKRLSVFLSTPIAACQKTPLSLTHVLPGVSPAVCAGSGASLAGWQLRCTHPECSRGGVLADLHRRWTFLLLHTYTIHCNKHVAGFPPGLSADERSDYWQKFIRSLVPQQKAVLLSSQRGIASLAALRLGKPLLLFWACALQGLDDSQTPSSNTASQSSSSHSFFVVQDRTQRWMSQPQARKGSDSARGPDYLHCSSRHDWESRTRESIISSNGYQGFACSWALNAKSMGFCLFNY